MHKSNICIKPARWQLKFKHNLEISRRKKGFYLQGGGKVAFQLKVREEKMMWVQCHNNFLPFTSLEKETNARAAVGGDDNTRYIWTPEVNVPTMSIWNNHRCHFSEKVQPNSTRYQDLAPSLHSLLLRWFDIWLRHLLLISMSQLQLFVQYLWIREDVNVDFLNPHFWICG